MFSIACHIVYLQNFSQTWPLISLTSPAFLSSCVLVIADHFIWFFYFSRVTHQARYSRSYRGGGPMAPGFTEIASFFGICVWLAPLFLFLSLSANDNALPTASGMSFFGTATLTCGNNHSTLPGSSQSTFSVPSPSTRISLFRSIFSWLPFSRTRSHRDGNGIIAPRSPQVTRAPPPPQFSPLPASPLMQLAPARSPGPPRSPGAPRSPLVGVQELEVSAAAPTSSTNFRLRAPPVTRRSAQAVRANGNALGLGVRRSTQPSQDDVAFQ